MEAVCFVFLAKQTFKIVFLKPNFWTHELFMQPTGTILRRVIPSIMLATLVEDLYDGVVY